MRVNPIPLLLLVLLISCTVYAQDGPLLPEGLQPKKEESKKDEGPALPEGLDPEKPKTTEGPSLPKGLEGPKTDEGPALPPGLTEKPPEERPSEKKEGGSWLPDGFSGFWEGRMGFRTQHDRYERDWSIGETRLQLAYVRDWRSLLFNLRADLLFDGVEEDRRVDIDEGRGWLDLREANFSASPLSFMDVKIGRQILTWGTGDLIFLNDLFPKDWNAFFSGRDTEYLKAPSDAAKFSFFWQDVANLDVVYVPGFDSDRFIDGRRISYWNGMLGRRAGRDAIQDPIKRGDWFTDDEVHLRLYRNVGAYELAAYGYTGYWKSPTGFDMTEMKPFYPRLAVWGASARGPVFKGIGNVETAYYDSRDDHKGSNPLIPNGQWRFLAGYTQEIARDFTAGAQYYVEYMADYGSYRRTLPPGSVMEDEARHVVTLRLTRLLMQQNLKLSLFAYYSPTDDDAYLRPSIHYKIDDHWSAEFGANVFFGEDPNTFFGQFARNTNLYFALRYGF